MIYATSFVILVKIRGLLDEDLPKKFGEDELCFPHLKTVYWHIASEKVALNLGISAQEEEVYQGCPAGFKKLPPREFRSKRSEYFD